MQAVILIIYDTAFQLLTINFWRPA